MGKCGGEEEREAAGIREVRAERDDRYRHGVGKEERRGTRGITVTGRRGEREVNGEAWVYWWAWVWA